MSESGKKASCFNCSVLSCDLHKIQPLKLPTRAPTVFRPGHPASIRENFTLSADSTSVINCPWQTSFGPGLLIPCDLFLEGLEVLLNPRCTSSKNSSKSSNKYQKLLNSKSSNFLGYNMCSIAGFPNTWL